MTISVWSLFSSSRNTIYTACILLCNLILEKKKHQGKDFQTRMHSNRMCTARFSGRFSCTHAPPCHAHPHCHACYHLAMYAPWPSPPAMHVPPPHMAPWPCMPLFIIHTPTLHHTCQPSPCMPPFTMHVPPLPCTPSLCTLWIRNFQ